MMEWENLNNVHCMAEYCCIVSPVVPVRSVWTELNFRVICSKCGDTRG